LKTVSAIRYKRVSRAALLLAVAVVATTAATGSADAGSRPVPDPGGTRVPCPGPASARAAYLSTWTAVRRYFGAAGMPAPRFAFGERRVREMRVNGTTAGYRRVEVLATEREALAGRRGCRETLSARECLIHEFVHVFQAEPYASGEIRPDQIFEEIPEGLAEARAQSLMREVYGERRGTYDQGIWATYDAYAREIRKRYPPALIRRGQFGDNWGRNPRLIPWREPNPAVEGGAARRPRS
jgi:hypothetical protein